MSKLENYTKEYLQQFLTENSSIETVWLIKEDGESDEVALRKLSIYLIK